MRVCQSKENMLIYILERETIAMQSSVSGDVIMSPSVRQKDRMFPSDERNLLRDATRELLIKTVPWKVCLM